MKKYGVYCVSVETLRFLPASEYHARYNRPMILISKHNVSKNNQYKIAILPSSLLLVSGRLLQMAKVIVGFLKIWAE